MGHRPSDADSQAHIGANAGANSGSQEYVGTDAEATSGSQAEPVTALGIEVDTDPDTDAAAEARARALSSPLRMRVLRLCLHQARTNQELAELLHVNPGTMLHHVRTLVDTGFLAPEDARTGKRGAREVPYRATGRSWRTPVPAIGPILIETLLQELQGVPADDVHVARLGLKLNPAGVDELHSRFTAVMEEFMNRDPDPDGVPISITLVVHPEQLPAP